MHSKNVKILLGIGSLLPLLGVAVYTGLMIYIVGQMSRDYEYYSMMPQPASARVDWTLFIAPMAVILLTAVLTLVMVVVYVMDVAKSKKFKSDMQIVWILLLVFAGVLAFPVYWYMHIWNAPENPPPVPQNPF